jgi:uncharacterized protein (TIGR03435 family)
MFRAPGILPLAVMVIAAQAPTAFEVASVKPSAPSPRWGWGADAGGAFHADNMTLKQLVAVAYGVQDFQVAGVEPWIASEHWDIRGNIRAKAATDAKLSNDEVRTPLRALLMQRFSLKVRVEQRQEVSAYAIRIGSEGAKMKPADEGSNNARIAAGRIDGQRISMERLAQMLSILLGRPTADKTGLTGEYNVSLEWTPEPDEGTQMFGPVRDAEFRRGGSIFSAIEEQLGLHLEVVKQPVDVIVIENAVRATSN